MGATRLAVYGTLRRGGPANHLLRGATFIATDHIEGSLFALGDLPCLKLTGGSSGKVVVDIYDIPEDDTTIMDRINRYEGFFPDSPDQSLYVQRTVMAANSLMPVTVFEYKFNVSNSVKIANGDWLDW